MQLDKYRILVVEDDYMLARDLRQELEDAGMVVIGPEPSVGRALFRIAGEARIDAAVLDVNLGDELAFPIADALIVKHIPFVFATGYEEYLVSTRYPDAVSCNKPLDVSALLRSLEKVLRPA